MEITARMYVSTITDGGYQEKHYEQVNLVPVYSSDKNSPNYSYSENTPNGALSLTITNRSAWGAFEVGKEYDISIKPRD